MPTRGLGRRLCWGWAGRGCKAGEGGQRQGILWMEEVLMDLVRVLRVLARTLEKSWWEIERVGEMIGRKDDGCTQSTRQEGQLERPGDVWLISPIRTPAHSRCWAALAGAPRGSALLPEWSF